MRTVVLSALALAGTALLPAGAAERFSVIASAPGFAQIGAVQGSTF